MALPFLKELSESDSLKRPIDVMAYLLNGHSQTLNNIHFSLQMRSGMLTVKKLSFLYIFFNTFKLYQNLLIIFELEFIFSSYLFIYFKWEII